MAFDDGLISMAQDHGAPGGDIVDIPVAICIVQISAFCFGYKQGRSAHAFEGSYGRIDTTGNGLLGTLENDSLV